MTIAVSCTALALWLGLAGNSSPQTSPSPPAQPSARHAISLEASAPASDISAAPGAASRPKARLAKRELPQGDAAAEPPQRPSQAYVRDATVAEIKRALPGVKVLRAMPQIDVVVVEPGEPSTSAEELATQLRRAGLDSAASVPVYPAALPNDTYFADQWGFENTGQDGGTIGADSKAHAAWDWSRGAGTVVAVTDTGVDFSAADLSAQAWANPDEVAGNGVDDDGNGLVDDINGWDFLNDDKSVFDLGDGDQHGTHVAGTVGARTNNGAGVAGMAWDTKIMSVKFLGQHEGSDIDGAAAIVYAVDEGADVINASWGATTYSPVVESAIEYAAAHDVLVVCAAGNNGANTDSAPYYPASLPATNIVSVAALDRNDGLASFSNRGATSVDIGAPGVDVLSTVPRWGAGILVDDAPFRAVYLPFQAESISDTAVRGQVISKAMAQLATSTVNPVLLVDDSWGSLTAAWEPATRRRTAYLTALNAAGYTNVSTWSTDASGTPPAAVMAGKTVVWFTGAATFAIPSVWPTIETHGTLTTAERAAVGAYLDGGGRLLISSGDLAYEMTYLAATKGTLTWFRNYLHARYLSDDPGMYTVLGKSGSIYSGMSWTIDDWLRYSDGCDSIGTYDAAAAPIALWPHDFMYMDGTSMASPHVAGAVALMKSRMPQLTAAELKSRLLSAADPVSSLNGLSVTGARLDAAEAVGRIAAPTALEAWASGSTEVQLQWRNAVTPDFATTRIVSRVGTAPVGPTDSLATVVYEGAATSTVQTGLDPGDVVHFAAYSRSSLGGWSDAATATLTVPLLGSGVPIPVGTDVSVTHEGVTLTFPRVDAAGWLSITRVPESKAAPTGMRWLPDSYYEIHPVGRFSYPVDVTLPYTASSLTSGESTVRVYHDTGSWDDITVSVDAAGDVVHARTDSFSEFALAEPSAAEAAAEGVNVEASAELPPWAYLATAAAIVALAIRRRRSAA